MPGNPDSKWHSRNYLNGICAFLQIVTALSGLVIIYIHGHIFSHDWTAFRGNKSYNGNDMKLYNGSPTSGYLDMSSVPKQVAAIGFVCIYALFVLLLCLFVMALDSVLLVPWARRVIKSTGLKISYGNRSGLAFVFGVALLKTVAGACVGSRSLINFGDGNGLPQQVSSVDTWHARYIATWYIWAYMVMGYAACLWSIRLREAIEDTGGRKLMVTRRDALAIGESKRGGKHEVGLQA